MITGRRDRSVAHASEGRKFGKAGHELSVVRLEIGGEIWRGTIDQLGGSRVSRVIGIVMIVIWMLVIRCAMNTVRV